MNQIIEWSQGNPGALNFLMQVFMSRIITINDAQFAQRTIEKYTTLRGTNLYVLYSDLCDKNMDKVFHLLRNCPQDILEDACSRQDYSGRELVSKYFNVQ